MKGSPAFSFYPKDYESDEHVKLMSLEQEGAYLRLLCHAWLQGSIPSDVRSVAAICRITPAKMTRLWPGVRPCWAEAGGGRLVNGRQERERAKQSTFRQGQSDKGKKGGRPKKPEVSPGFDSVKAHESLPSPSPSALPSPTPSEDLARHGPPGRLEALHAEVNSMLDELVAMNVAARDELLWDASNTGSRRITNVVGCTSVRWLETTRDRLLDRRMLAKRQVTTPDQELPHERKAREVAAERLARGESPDAITAFLAEAFGITAAAAARYVEAAQQ